jgi:hypothetical protein
MATGLAGVGSGSGRATGVGSGTGAGARRGASTIEGGSAGSAGVARARFLALGRRGCVAATGERGVIRGALKGTGAGAAAMGDGGGAGGSSWPVRCRERVNPVAPVVNATSVPTIRMKIHRLFTVGMEVVSPHGVSWPGRVAQEPQGVDGRKETALSACLRS